jgi:predicted phage tail protein
MSQETESGSSVGEFLDDEEEHPLFLRPLVKMRRSFLWFLIGSGALMIAAGALVDVVYGGLPVAAILAVMGISVALAGVLTRSALVLIGYQ